MQKSIKNIFGLEDTITSINDAHDALVTRVITAESNIATNADGIQMNAQDLNELSANLYDSDATNTAAISYFISELENKLVNGASVDLDQLNELAAAMNDDPDFYASVQEWVGNLRTELIGDTSLLMGDPTFGAVYAFIAELMQNFENTTPFNMTVSAPINAIDLVNTDGDYVDLDGNVVAEADKITYGGVDLTLEGFDSISQENFVGLMPGSVILTDGSGVVQPALSGTVGTVPTPTDTLFVGMFDSDYTSLVGETLFINISVGASLLESIGGSNTVTIVEDKFNLLSVV